MAPDFAALALEKIRRFIKEERGWAVQGVVTEHPWTYTIGLEETFGHPELVLFGLPNTTAANLLNHAGERIRAGETFEVKKRYEDFLPDFNGRVLGVELRQVPIPAHLEYFGMASRFYGDPASYRMLQVVWPDAEDRLPWDLDFTASLRTLQPVLDEDWLRRN